MLGTQIIPSLPSTEHIVVILFAGSSWTHILSDSKNQIDHPLNNLILFSYPDWLPHGGQWHFALDNKKIKKNRKAAASSLLNRILLKGNTVFNEMQFN